MLIGPSNHIIEKNHPPTIYHGEFYSRLLISFILSVRIFFLQRDGQVDNESKNFVSRQRRLTMTFGS